jgi:glucan phosphoethanolaminetransferase (alkaline phosphatase superfamily)
METKQEIQSFKSKLFKFYFINRWYSFLSIAYFIAFSFFTIYYFDNVILALKFILYTINMSTAILGLNYLLWGTLFIIVLVTPFLVSIFAILNLLTIWKKEPWIKSQKVLATIISLVGIFAVIIMAENMIQTIIKYEVLNTFMIQNNLIEKIN